MLSARRKLSAIASLGYVMRYAGYHHARAPSHRAQFWIAARTSIKWTVTETFHPTERIRNGPIGTERPLAVVAQSSYLDSGGVVMGYSISWLGLPLHKTEAIHLLGFRDTGQADEANEAPFSAAQLPNNWTIIWSNDFDFGSAQHLDALSNRTKIISCQVEEHIMFSACHCSFNGQPLWSVWHDGQEGVYDIHAAGTAVSQLAGIEARQRALQDANGGAEGGVDYGFDIAVELAAELTTYRHDRWQFAWGEPQFSVIERGR